ncbi:DUF305 domain-containing protein [Candidatus Pacearchaeota archaeon]|nr:DUF305 domain-containing protein [Candidatus Pacearchaeota archaeon]
MKREEKKAYKKFFLMLGVSFLIMYFAMFLNVFSINHIYFSLTRVYMALLMVAPMSLSMMFFMRKMYKNKKLNRIIIITSIAVFVLALFFLRSQILISDEQYMKAMIPHHSSAILTSNYADIQDPEVQKLAKDIIDAQEREIELMENILEGLHKE